MRGKVVLITGASSGIGAGTAVLFASRGCLLTLTGRSEEGLGDTKLACIQAGAKEEDILLISADLQDLQNLARIVNSTVENFGRLDILVNNAACSHLSNLESFSVEKYDMIMNTNVKAIFFLTQYAMPHLIRSQGNVVNVSSVLAQRSAPISIAYCMSKAAVDHFTRIVALDVAPRHVRVNAVSPGGVKTAIYDRCGFPDTFDFEKVAKKVHAMGRAGTVDEMAKAIEFLADDKKSSFITGVVLNVDGGSLLKGPL